MTYEQHTYTDCDKLVAASWLPPVYGSECKSVFVGFDWQIKADPINGFINWYDHIDDMKRDWPAIQERGTIQGPWTKQKFAVILDRLWSLIREDATKEETKPPAKKARR